MRQSASALILALLISLTLSACDKEDVDSLSDTLTTRSPPICPDLKVSPPLAFLTKFKPGPGRDITDIEWQAEFSNFLNPTCAWDGDNSIHANFTASFYASLRPAAQTRAADIEYFVTLVKAENGQNRIIAKESLPVTLTFPPNTNTIRHIDSEIDLTIPVEEGEVGRGYAIILGFQVTDDELAYNRERLKRMRN